MHMERSISMRVKLAAPRKAFLCTPFVARILTPGHENPVIGLFLGVDQVIGTRRGSDKNFFGVM